MAASTRRPAPAAGAQVPETRRLSLGEAARLAAAQAAGVQGAQYRAEQALEDGRLVRLGRTPLEVGRGLRLEAVLVAAARLVLLLLAADDERAVGEHLELATDMGSGVKWYVFGGGGMVRVSQRSEAPSQDRFNAFWKPAAMGGVGMFINVPRSNLDVMIEGKVLGYEFDRAGFDRILWDATWGLGLAYRIALR